MNKYTVIYLVSVLTAFIGTAMLVCLPVGFLMNDPETVLLIDSWKDQASLDIHHASPMMGTIAALREKYDLHMRAERYVSDEAGLPDADKKFIKT